MATSDYPSVTRASHTRPGFSSSTRSQRWHYGPRRYRNLAAPVHHQPRPLPYELWVTDVTSGTAFYAQTERFKIEAQALKTSLAAQMEETCTPPEKVVRGMVCATKVDGTWQRVKAQYLCGNPTCAIREAQDQKGYQKTSDDTKMDKDTSMDTEKLKEISEDIEIQKDTARDSEEPKEIHMDPEECKITGTDTEMQQETAGDLEMHKDTDMHGDELAISADTGGLKEPAEETEIHHDTAPDTQEHLNTSVDIEEDQKTARETAVDTDIHQKSSWDYEDMEDIDMGSQEHQDTSQGHMEQRWHMDLMDVGPTRCVSLSEMALLTREIAWEPPKTHLFLLRGVLPKPEFFEEAKEWLKAAILLYQPLRVVCFSSPYNRRYSTVEVTVDGVCLNDAIVKAGFAKYQYLTKQEMEEGEEEEVVNREETPWNIHRSHSASSSKDRTVNMTCQIRKLLKHKSRRPMHEVIELITRLMKRRKEIFKLTDCGSVLNKSLHILQKSSTSTGSANRRKQEEITKKKQSLLRKLQEENAYVTNFMDLKEPHFLQLLNTFLAWKVSYKAAQSKSNEAISSISNVFTNLPHMDSGIEKFRKKCDALEDALNGEMFLQNEGQDLAHLLVPGVFRRISASLKEDVKEWNGHSLHHYVTECRRPISSVILETLAKDILKDLHMTHKLGTAYKHLHPGNVLIIGGRATLRKIEHHQHCDVQVGNWPFKAARTGTEDSEDKASDVFDFAVLLLWMSCRGAKNYMKARMKNYCNVAVLKLAMVKNPKCRAEVKNFLSPNVTFFPINVAWKGKGMPLVEFMDRNGMMEGCTGCNHNKSNRSISDARSVDNDRSADDGNKSIDESFEDDCTSGGDKSGSPVVFMMTEGDESSAQTSPSESDSSDTETSQADPLSSESE